MTTHTPNQFTPVDVRMTYLWHEMTGTHGVVYHDHHAVVCDDRGVRIYERMTCEYCGSNDPDRNIDRIDFEWGPFHLATAYLCDDDACIDAYDTPQPTADMHRRAWSGAHA